MKVGISRVPFEGARLEEEVPAANLDLETEDVRFRSPLKVRAEISRISNALSVDLSVEALTCMRCARCLEEFEVPLRKRLSFNYSVGKLEREIDLGPDIREEIILDYPIKPLCRPDCKGLCHKCGRNLNRERCKC
ncbi:MAG: YceD family protein [Candidatus Omnitrophota bacterium]|nr:YceD family protein [Candidatus Omnitrophota bacterium]